MTFTHSFTQIYRQHHPYGINQRTNLLMKVKEEGENTGMKLTIQKIKIMASWQIDGEIMETVAGFISLGSKITADDDCSPEIKRCLLFGRKITSNLDSISKSRDITLLKKVYLVRLWFFQ